MPQRNAPEARTLRELWELHESEPFPAAWAGRRVEGHCLLTLDAQVSGCARAFFEQRGFLGYYGAGVLLECHLALAEVLEELDRQRARNAARGWAVEWKGSAVEEIPGYVLRMHELTGRMLAYTSRRQASAPRAHRWWQEPARRRA